MPLYEVEYGCALTKAQRQALANDITKLHHEIYHVPSFFVAVKLTDGSGSENYSGGKEVKVNRIYATVRTGGARIPQDFDKLCLRLVEVWNQVVLGGETLSEEEIKRRSLRLNGVFVLRSMESSFEEGGLLPHTEPGEDERWMRSNLAEWKKRAEAGDGDFQSVVKDVEAMMKDI